MAYAVPPEVPADAAAIARSTLGGAFATAQQLPIDIGNELLAVAHAAFTRGMVLSAAIAAVAMIVVAVLALTRLRAAPSQENSNAG